MEFLAKGGLVAWALLSHTQTRTWGIILATLAPGRESREAPWRSARRPHPRRGNGADCKSAAPLGWKLAPNPRWRRRVWWRASGENPANSTLGLTFFCLWFYRVWRWANDFPMAPRRVATNEGSHGLQSMDPPSPGCEASRSDAPRVRGRASLAALCGFGLAFGPGFQLVQFASRRFKAPGGDSGEDLIQLRRQFRRPGGFTAELVEAER